jgi:hypothetical protein
VQVADWSFSGTPIVDTRKQIVGLLMRHERKAASRWRSPMIDPEPPPLGPPKTIPSDEDYERLAAALREFSDDQWVCDFIKRLNYTIEDIVRKK